MSPEEVNKIYTQRLRDALAGVDPATFWREYRRPVSGGGYAGSSLDDHRVVAGLQSCGINARRNGRGMVSVPGCHTTGVQQVLDAMPRHVE